MKNLIIMLALGASVPALANIRHYQADMDTSAWEVADKSRIQCKLRHEIPGYGEALFISKASKKLNMAFELDMLRLPNTYSAAEVYSMPPRWMPGETQRIIGSMPIRRQYDGDLPSKAAWNMLTELEKGFLPTIYYKDWYNDRDKITVGLSAINFSDAYDEFSRCMANLLPFSFEDIAFTVLSYKKNSIELTNYSKKKLQMIGDYLMEDKDLELVLLDGYSDSYGSRSKNKTLSVQRAMEVKNYFSELGVDAGRIELTGHGERRHIAPNDTDTNRAKNRRVVVRMAKT